MKTNSKLLFVLAAFIFATLFSNRLTAKTLTSIPGAWTYNTLIPNAPSNISFSGTDFSSPIIATLTNYQAYSSMTFTCTNTIDASTNLQLGFAADIADKQMLVTLTDGSGKSTSMDLTALLLMSYNTSITTSTPTENYSINFNQVTRATGIALSAIKKINFTIYDHKTGSLAGTTSPILAGKHVLIYLQEGTGTPTTSTLLNPTQGQEWGMEATGYMYNANNDGVIIGDPTTNNIAGLLSYPYYNFIVNGRTNFIGNDNAIGIWSATVPTTGFRHYLGMSNATFTAAGSTTTEYSMINAYEYNSAAGTGNQKHLILNNFSFVNGGPNGNVGIGYHTGAPLEKLSVNGNIRCKSLFVTAANWADYVFDEQYKLKSLDEVKQFVQTEKHLPGVPSEKELLEKGINVNDMLKVHMEKIEELTLYIIKQQAQIDALTKKLDQSSK